jgi:hypothetical protein
LAAQANLKSFVDSLRVRIRSKRTVNIESIDHG